MLKFYEKCFVGAVIATVFLVVGFFGCQNVLAQSNSATGANATSSVSKIQIVATVEIYSASIVSQQNNQFNLSFDFFNKEGVQPGIKYAVQLLKDNADGSQTLVDEYVYPEVVDLKESETKKMEISYTAPEYLQGEFLLWMASKNSSGLPLAFGNLGKVVLNGSGEFMEIIPETCFLVIEGSATSKKYMALEGAFVKPEENLIVSCQVINHLSQDIKAVSQFQTFLGTSFGDEVVLDVKSQNIVDLKPSQQTEVSFSLPKSNIPQTYETKLWLMAGNKPVSNKVVLRYTIAGQSATIQNIILDKEFYKKGETAQIKLLWLLWNANQLGGQISFIIKDKQGKLCSDIINQSLDKQDNFLTLSATIIRDCAEPKIEATIKDSQGDILDSKTFSVSAEQATTTLPTGLWRRYEKFIFGAVIVLVLLLAFIITIRKKKLSKTVSLFFVLGFVVCFNFLFCSEAKAVTYMTTECRSSIDNSIIFKITYTASLNKSTYYPRETLTANGTASYTSNTGCSPTLYWSTLTFSDGGNPSYDDILTSAGTSPQGSSRTIGATPGNYTPIFTTSWSSSCGTGCAGGLSTWNGPSYKIVCVPLGSSGCGSYSSACCSSNTCSDNKCCVGYLASCDATCKNNNYCCPGQVYSLARDNIGRCCLSACPTNPSTYCPADIRKDGCDKLCAIGTKQVGCSTCTNECTSGQKQCSTNSSYKTCGNYDADTCLEWSSSASCPTGQTCSGSGVCSPSTCTNECTSGQKQCSTNSSYKTCEQLDGCWKWPSLSTSCPTGQTCSGSGTCSPSTCVNECSSGQKQCSSNSSYKTCGNYDADPCFEWSLSAFCPIGQCSGNGVCSGLTGGPEIYSVSDLPDPVIIGEGKPVTFVINWHTDGDMVQGHICRTNSSGGPSGAGVYCAHWCTTGWDENTGILTCSYTASLPDVGINNYYAIVCNQSNQCSASIFRTWTAKAPSVSLGYVSVQENIGDTPIKLNLISEIEALTKENGILKIFWNRLNQPIAFADLVLPDGPRASSVRVMTKSGVRAWKKHPLSCVFQDGLCKYNEDCCSGVCWTYGAGSCACRSNTIFCYKDAECCSGICSANKCVCIPAGGVLPYYIGSCQSGYGNVCCSGQCDVSTNVCK